MNRTQLKKLNIKKFRALSEIEIEFGTHITVICGKNGTSKSSILGIAAQIFSFEKDYKKDCALPYQTITGGSFKSQFNQHFRMSEKFDLPGSMQVHVEIIDGYSEGEATAELRLSTRSEIPRPVIRKNSTAPKGRESRNFTHPVIFLNLKRLYPITERDYEIIDFDYLNEHKEEFIALTNELLNRSSSCATGTTGTISSAVAHGNNYDQDSVSAGEDNAGQIVLAIMSFRKLKEEYPDYMGGLLLIDEADAGLFPAAQIKLIEMLNRECQDLNLQVVMTSHSPTLIEYTYEQSQNFRRRFKTIYLSNTFGLVQAKHDWSWPQINADIHTRTISVNQNISLPKINVYFEDSEAFDFFKVIMARQKVNKFLNLLGDISLSCNNYILLVQKKVSEFANKSIICLDADVDSKVRGKGFDSIIVLPGELPPDQLIFEYLYNLPADHNVWLNPLQFTKANLTQIGRPIINRLGITHETVELKKVIALLRVSENEGKRLRDLFKDFYNHQEFQSFLKIKSVEFNPWRNWVRDNQDQCDMFISNFLAKFCKTQVDGYLVDKGKLSMFEPPKP